MAEIAKSQDFTKTEGDPTAKAERTYELEQCDMDVALPWLAGNSKLKITTRTRAGVVLICSIAALLLALAGGAVAGIAVGAAHLTGWAVLVAALVTPAAYFSLAYVILAHMLARQARAKLTRDQASTRRGSHRLPRLLLRMGWVSHSRSSRGTGRPRAQTPGRRSGLSTRGRGGDV